MEKILNLKKLINNNNNDNNLKWYTMYKLTNEYLNLNDIEQAEEWVNKSYKLNDKRSENLYLLLKYFREIGNHKKALEYYNLGKDIKKPNKGLNIEENVYDDLFDYESTIIWYYLFEDKLEGLKKSINYLNKSKVLHYENVFNNLEYYIKPLKNNFINFKEFKFNETEGYFNSSSSLIRFDKDHFLMNIRYHNYYINPQGHYLSTEYTDGQYIVRTKNQYVFLDNNYNVISPQTKMPDDLTDLPRNSSRIKGLEDMRILKWNNKIYYSSASPEYSNYFRIIFGEYNIVNNSYNNNFIIKSPVESNCEKNWIPFIHHNKMHFVYNWSPLQIGEVNFLSKELQLTYQFDTPSYFKKLRGSANPFKYKNYWYCLTHSVKHTSPRKYWHQFVLLDRDTLKPKKFSLPFVFCKMNIEDCLSFNIENDVITFIFSEFDKNTCLLSISLNNLHLIDI